MIRGEPTSLRSKLKSKSVFACFILFWGTMLGSFAPAFEEPDQEVPLSGVPKLIRGQPQTEVFFENLTSFVIPKTEAHNRLFKKFQEAIATRSSVDFIGDPKKRVVLRLKGDAKSSPSKYFSEDISEGAAGEKKTPGNNKSEPGKGPAGNTSPGSGSGGAGGGGGPQS